MLIFRQYVAPLIVVLVFFVALVAVSARIFLPGDMAAPAPIEEVSPQTMHAQSPADKSLVTQSALITGLLENFA